MESDEPFGTQSTNVIATETGPDGHKYNGDLLISKQDQEAAFKDFPAVYHVLDDPSLRMFFAEHDLRANSAKRGSKAWGFWALMMALVALIIGSGEMLWKNLPQPIPSLLAGLGAAAGVFSFVIAGFGVLYGRRKKEWLHDRMQTELCRLFHFQTFLSHFPEVLNSILAVKQDPKSTETVSRSFSSLRAAWFSDFHVGLCGRGNDAKIVRQHLDGRLNNITKISIDEPTHAWLHPPFIEPTFTDEQLAVVEDSALVEFFRAYQCFRLQQQIQYASYQLRAANDYSKATRSEIKIRSEFPWFPGKHQPLKIWHSRLQTCWRVGIFGVVALHAFLLLCSLAKFHANHEVLHVLVIWFALIAVAARTLAEGQVLHREIQRYKEYLAVCTELNREFTNARTPVRRKLELMVRMELAAYEEMRVFLRDTSESSYIF